MSLLLKNSSCDSHAITLALESVHIAKSSPLSADKMRELYLEETGLRTLYKKATGKIFERPLEPSDTEKLALKCLYEICQGARWRRNQVWGGRTESAKHRALPPFQSHPEYFDGVITWKGHVSKLLLHHNGMVGELPAGCFDNLPNLEELDLSCNTLHGQIPREMCRLRHLRILNLSATLIEGSLPDDFFSCLGGLLELDLSFTRLSGSLPTSIGECAKLQSLRLAMCSFTGFVPRELEKLHLLREISLRGNQLQGSLPDLTNCSKLEDVDFSCNRFCGQLPPWPSCLYCLRKLRLNNNLLEGDLAHAFVQQGERELKLEVLHLQSNFLSGSVPDYLAEMCPNLKVVNISKNELTGTVPASFGTLSTLLALDLSDNFIQGPLPPALGGLSATLVDFSVVKGHKSRLLPLSRAFSQEKFALVFNEGPKLGLNNTNYPRGKDVHEWESAIRDCDPPHLKAKREDRMVSLHRHALKTTAIS